MQGDHHEIEAEFPDFRKRLEELKASDAEFAASVKRHNELDSEIRKLEELGQPVSDEAIEKMKFERAELKDSIYARLRAGA